MIEFQNVTKRFPDGTYAVKDFSLVVPSRKVTVFVGSSGAGKTTLLRMINRMVNPTSGKVLIDGEDVANLNPVALRRKIGYVLQATGLLPHRRITGQHRFSPSAQWGSEEKSPPRRAHFAGHCGARSVIGR
jgi:osmoprotectant transport system ATP-binding protein